MHALIFLGGEFAALRRPLPEADRTVLLPFEKKMTAPEPRLRS